MVFKHKLFSSSSSKKKKSSESSSSDNSPRSIGSNSPIGSDKKKSKSESGDETWRLNLRSLFAGGKDGSAKKKTDLSSSSSDSDSKPPCDVASKPPLVASSSIGWNRFDSRSDLGSVVPKVVTHLGSGSVPVDSGSVPADSGSVPADSGSVSADSGSGLATSGSVSAASCLVSAAFGSGLAASGSVSAASGSVSAASGSVSATFGLVSEASAAYGSVSDAYGLVSAASGSGLAARRSVSAASGSGLPASGSGLPASGSSRGNAKKEAESSSRPALPPSGAGKFKVRPSMSGPIGSSESENSKESESTRYLALLRLTSASRKRFPGDFKSFSQELNSKGLQLFPQWKPRRSSNMEEITNLIRGKFKKAKEEVDSDLLVFGGDLMGLLDSGHELQVEIENLLILARECDKYTSEEFWLKCESIVQELDDRRQELSPGVLKQLHSRMLFILTRCTRLLQFHKESWGQKQEILQLRSVGKRVPTKKAYSQEQHCLDWKEDFASPAPISSLYIETSKDFETPVNIERMSSWKKLPSPVSKGVKEDVVSIAQNNRQTEPTKVVESRVVTSADNIDVVKLPDCPPRKLSREHVLKDGHSSWGYWGDQSYISEESSIICRICEEEIPTTHVEDHSRICALADKYDQKGVSVNERLFSVAVTLEKLAESFIQKGNLAAVESPDSVKISNASSTGESDVLSPELSDCSRRGSVDMVDCVSEVDSSTSMDDIRSLTSMSCRTRVGPKSDQGMTTSSASCVTPRSPILDAFELFLGGKDTFNEHDDIPKMGELADVARSAANTIPGDEASIQTLLSCIEDSRVVVESRKFDALIVETFGNRIEKLIQEKYLKLCGILVDDKVNLSGTVIDEDAPLDGDVVHSSRKSSVHPRERTSIEDFEMLKPISKGAFGSVFLAKKKITGDLFAIKVLKKADTIRKNAVESILAERDILINAHNPFVVRFFYSFTCRENLYLVMEYLNGGDLYSLLAKIGRLDESIARVYIAELVLALEYIHSQGVVHRDLKPDNLLIAHDGHVKLTDFGLSKVGLINITDDLSGPVFKGESLLVEEKPKVPTSEYQLKRRDKRSVVGTPDYLAPEILLGKGHGATADWWSVGIILYELIVGIPPFNDAQPQQIFDNILNRDIPWPHIPEEISYEAHDLIDRLLTADPHQRLGAKGAAEVKEHVFFKDINWHTLAEQKAAFVPETESALDTSYFQSRHSMNSSDLKRCRNNENGESSGSGSCLSNHHNDVVNERDDPTSVVSPFENFSFKNHMQLAYINIDLMSKCQKDANSVEF